MALGEIFELLDWLIHGLTGWRYLFSRSYRLQLRQKWRGQSRWVVVGDVTWKMASFLFTLCFVGVIAFVLIDLTR